MENSGPYVACLESPIGLLRITSTESKICSILFRESPENGVLVTPVVPNVLKECVEQLDAYFKGERRTFDFEMEQPGTPFQLKVWRELEKLPFGSTISYRDLSVRIGDQKLVRAVGTANGKNQLAIVVPCHRVIGADGSLVGYGGKIWRKRWLLEHEAKYAHGVQTLFLDSV